MRNLYFVSSILLLACLLPNAARSQEGLGPFIPNEGGTITTAWANAYGPDAESWMAFAKVGPENRRVELLRTDR